MSWIYKDLVLTQCCFCMPLHNGAMMISILETVGGALSILAGLVTLTTHHNLIISMLSYWSEIVSGILLAIEGLCLLFGVIRSNELATTVHLGISMISDIFYWIMTVIYLVLAIQGVHLAFNYFAIFLIVAVLQLYSNLCVLSFLKTLKIIHVVSAE